MKTSIQFKNRNLPLNLRSAFLQTIRFSIIAVIALFVLQNSVVNLQAQMKNEPSAAELEQFRSDLMMTIHNLNASIAKMKRNPKVRQAIENSGKNMIQLGELQMQFQKLSYEELKTIYLSYNQNFPDWRESAGKMELLAEKIGGKYPEKFSGDNTSSAITPDNCQDAFNEQPSFSDLAFTRGFEIEAQAAYEVIPEPLNGIALAAWAPLAAGGLAIETLNSIYDRCSGDQSDAAVQSRLTEIYERVDTNADYVIDRLTTVGNNNKAMIVNNDNSNKTMIVDAITSAQTSINQNTNASQTAITTAVTNAKTEIVNNDNSNRTTIINNDNSNASTLNTNVNNTRTAIISNDNTNTTNIINTSNANTTLLNTAITNAKTEIINNATANKNELSKLLLRTQIEADLASESNSVKVAWYLTPTAQGGHLDYVQQIVTLTLANIVAAGGSIGNAQNFLDKANADKAAGNFKSAYDNYRKAYKAAGN